MVVGMVVAVMVLAWPGAESAGRGLNHLSVLQEGDNGWELDGGQMRTVELVVNESSGYIRWFVCTGSDNTVRNTSHPNTV